LTVIGILEGPNKVIETRYHDTVNVLQELLEDSFAGKPRTPFDRAEWYALLAQTGLNPLIATAHDGKRDAVLALTDCNGHLSPLRNWYSFTWRALAPEGEEGDRMLREIAKQLKARAHRVTLEPVPGEDGSATRLSDAFKAAGWRVEVTRCDTNHVLRVEGRSFDQYWSTRPGHLRTTLKRKAKKVETQVVSHFDQELWSAFEEIYKASWKPEEDHPAMLREFAQQEGNAGRLRLGVARHGETPVAAQFWTVEDGTAYIHKLAHLESANKLSAGTTLSAALFKHVIDTDLVEFADFGTGTQSYKADWMEATRPRYMIDCFNLSSPRAWLDLVRLTVRRLAQPEPTVLAPSPPRG
jgi:Acetyltransferase (GNAT) domain